MSFDRKALAQAVKDNLGDAGSGVAMSELEEVVYNLAGDGINSFPKAAMFLAKFPKLSRRIGAVALLNVFKANPNVFGAENAPYVRVINEVIESLAEGAGRAVADVEFTEAAGLEMAAKVEKVSKAKRIVAYDFTEDPITHKPILGKKIAHRGDGLCMHLTGNRARWLILNPPKTSGGGGDKRGPPPKTTPGDPYPESDMNETEAAEQADDYCRVCGMHFVIPPTWAKPSEPAKPKDWVDSFEPEFDSRIAHLHLIFNEVHAADALEYLKKVPVRLVKVLLIKYATADGNSLEDKVNPATGKVEGVIPSFLGLIRGQTDLDESTVQRFEGLIKAWADKNSPEGQAIIQAAEGKAVKVINAIQWPAAIIAILCVLAFLGIWFAFISGWIFGNMGLVLVGAFVLPITCILLSRLPKAVDWGMDMLRAVARKFIPDVPFVDSFFWFYNLTMDGSIFIAVLGLACAVSIGIWGGGWDSAISRLIIAGAGLFIIVRSAGRARWHFADRAYRSAEKTDSFLSWMWPVLLVGGIVLFPASCQQWQMLEGSGQIINGKVQNAMVNTEGLLVEELPLVDVIKDTSKVSWDSKTGEYYSKGKEIKVHLPGAIIEVDEEKGKYTYQWKPNLISTWAGSFIGRAVGADDLAKDLYELSSETSTSSAASASGSTTQSVGQHMWGQTHAFWLVTVVVAALVALIGFVTLMVMGAEEPTPGASKKLRGVWVGLAFVAIVCGLLTALVVGVPLGIDRIFEIGEQAETTQQATTQTAPVIQAAAPARQVSTPAKPEGKAKRGDTGRKHKRIDCSTIGDPVNHQSCLDAQR